MSGATAQTTSISLDDHVGEFLAEQAGSGRHRPAGEVVRAGLRLLEDQEAQLAALRAALVAGEASGVPGAFDVDAFVAATKGWGSSRPRRSAGCPRSRT